MGMISLARGDLLVKARFSLLVSERYETRH